MNTTPLKELLIERASEFKRDRIHAAFVLHKAEILEAINEGWSVYSVWKTLVDAKKINMSYQAFSRLVKRAKNGVDLRISTTIPSSSSGFTMDTTPDKNKLY